MLSATRSSLLKTRSSLCPLCLSRSIASAPSPSASSQRSSSRATSIPHPVLDLAEILSDPAYIKQNLVDRKYPLDPSVVDEIRRMELEAVGLRKELQRARERRNVVSASPSAVLADQGKKRMTAAELKVEGAAVKALVKSLEPRLATLTKTVQALALQLPNTCHPSAPVGPETAAKIVNTLGPPIPSPPPAAIPSLDHLHLSSPTNLDWTDFPSASLVSGAAWPYLLHEGALLELALTNYAMSIALSHGFTPVLTPDVVRADVAERCGFRPREDDAQQTYFLSDGTPSSPATLCLTGTAEIPLVAMSAGSVFSHAQLPRKHVALGRAFRAEAGARGADSRGLYRVHQFSKVEMVVVCAEEDSDRILLELKAIQEGILGSLGLSLRVLDMPTEELGASAHRKFDIEAWMPGRGKWGELSSASNCTDYQSRRLGIRYRPAPFDRLARPPLEDLAIPTPAALEATALYPHQAGGPGPAPKVTYAHTLNATAAAIPRLIVALLENGAVLEGEKVVRVRLPSVLRRFWIGEEGRIEWVPEGEALRKEV